MLGNPRALDQRSRMGAYIDERYQYPASSESQISMHFPSKGPMNLWARSAPSRVCSWLAQGCPACARFEPATTSSASASTKSVADR
jgi:hypothetical protein